MTVPVRISRPSARRAAEIEFLPAHLELIERPVSVTARTLAATLAAIFCVALGWSYLGKMDIVASAPGRIVATTRSKTIQPMETASVRHVYVADGDTVRMGQPLIDLDDTSATTERTKASEALVAAGHMAERKALLLSGLDGTTIQPGPYRDEVAADLAQLDYAQYVANKQVLEAVLKQRRREAASAKGQIHALATSADISRQRSEDTGKLVTKGHVSRHEFLQREQERVDAARIAEAQMSRHKELKAAEDAAYRDLQAHISTTRQEAADQLRQAQESAAQYAQDLANAEQRIRQLHLTSPVDGTVQQLAVHTVGGVVTPGQALMTVVPQDDPLEVEATVLNQDIGFLRPGQPVTVKIETFPYTRYGFVLGSVASVSHDAVQDEKLGLVFPARIRIDSALLDIDGVAVSLTPGMTVTAEVKTGRRRVLDYLLSPLQEHIHDSARER
ncbi:HlyD family type I secretion periplasmic adaptor subunit [Bacillus sp. NP157]|nr:HlyD family type I secretion periplasmic adaptor subunit [Bacillus sp. NP157]